MKITETQKFKLKKFVKELDQFRRTHTELITVYIPQGYEITKIINHLQQEQGTATNIKSAYMGEADRSAAQPLSNAQSRSRSPHV